MFDELGEAQPSCFIKNSKHPDLAPAEVGGIMAEVVRASSKVAKTIDDKVAKDIVVEYKRSSVIRYKKLI